MSTRLQELKSQGYDLIAQIQFLQKQLEAVNADITQEAANEKQANAGNDDKVVPHNEPAVDPAAPVEAKPQDGATSENQPAAQ